MIERKHYSNLPAPVGPYVHGVKHNDTVYLSGVTAFGTPAQEGSLVAQLQSVFQQISAIAEEEGGSLADLLKVTLFVTDLSELLPAREALLKIYGDHLPASSVIKVEQLFLPSLKIEVEAILAARC